MSAHADRPRVLCVDDEPHVLEGLRDSLHRSFDVRTATGAGPALAMLRAQPEAFAVLISDMRMPGKSGDAFLLDARAVAPMTVRMVLTGHADIDAAIRAVNHGQLFRFLTKPCSREELMRACAAALGQHRLMTAERVLLEQTLRGSIDALTQVLALTNPAAFGRGARIRALAGALAEAAELRNRWEVEVAAMLAQLGAVTLPQATVERLYAGDELSEEEQRMVARVPDLTRALLARIPRLEGVLAILDGARVTCAPQDWAALDRVPLGALALRIATDFDQLQSHGVSEAVALATMSGRGIYDRRLLSLFAGVVGVNGASLTVREIPLRRLVSGMVLADDVRNRGGSLLVARGQPVTDQLIERLVNLGSDAVREPITVFDPAAGSLEGGSLEGGSLEGGSLEDGLIEGGSTESGRAEARR